MLKHKKKFIFFLIIICAISGLYMEEMNKVSDRQHRARGFPTIITEDDDNAGWKIATVTRKLTEGSGNVWQTDRYYFSVRYKIEGSVITFKHDGLRAVYNGGKDNWRSGQKIDRDID